MANNKAPAWGGPPLEDLSMWAMFQPGQNHKCDYDVLRDNVMKLCHMAQQKTAGQRKDKPKDIPFVDLDFIKWMILLEACQLVLSGDLDKLEKMEGGTGKMADFCDGCLHKEICTYADLAVSNCGDFLGWVKPEDGHPDEHQTSCSGKYGIGELTVSEPVLFVPKDKQYGKITTGHSINGTFYPEALFWLKGLKLPKERNA